MSLAQPVLVFDGDCGFCTWSVYQIRRFVRPHAEIVPWQLTDLDALGVTPDECMQAVQFVTSAGLHSSGSRAVAELFRHSPIPWPALGVIMDWPGISFVADRAYKWIAANRYKLPGATPACKVAA